MRLEEAFRKIAAEVQAVRSAGGYYGDVTLRIEAGRVVVIDYHRTEK